MKKYKNYSVLMSVYYKEKPEYLKTAIESIQSQTYSTDDFVLVCDGVLTPELYSVIDDKSKEMGDILNVIQLPKNVGLGNALDAGIKKCQHELIARMDSDDISFKDRCEKQITVFNTFPDISICSGTVSEFTETPENTIVNRVLPTSHNEIFEFAKKRNPFNHPCVMYKKSAVNTVGSYKDFYLLEDYYLWVRLLIAGYKGFNIQEPILFMRAGSQMYQRRSGIRYVNSQIKLFNYMKTNRFISNRQYITSCIIRSGSSLMPNFLRKYLYEKYLRK